MKFGLVATRDAQGAILAHSLSRPGFAFRKGRVLNASDVATLLAHDVADVMAARLEAGDVGEDEAAAAIAAAIAGGHVATSAPFTGRCNLLAAMAGVAVVDRGRIDRINVVDEAITVATLRPFAGVAERRMLATVKIIPYAAPGAAIERCLAIAAEGPPAITLAPFTPRTVGLIETVGHSVKPSAAASARTVVASRVAALGGTIVSEETVEHAATAVAAALGRRLDAGCDIVLIMGDSAIADRADAIPTAIAAHGGEIVRFGMPVDPGNLLLLARIGAAAVVGLPGCARSPKDNGFDWVLRRLFAGLATTAEDIAAMGVGGLISEDNAFAARKSGRRDADDANAAARAPRIAAVVLAAGSGRRMAGGNKLTVSVRGRPLVRRAVEAAFGSQLCDIVVVLGHDAEKVAASLDGLPARMVYNPRHAEGVSASLGCGLAAVDSAADAALILLGDMPDVTATHLDRLIAAFSPAEGRLVCIPTHNGLRGNPVLWGRACFPALAAATGDVGGRQCFDDFAGSVCEVAMPDRGVLVDVDDEDALRAASEAAVGVPR